MTYRIVKQDFYDAQPYFFVEKKGLFRWRAVRAKTGGDFEPLLPPIFIFECEDDAKDFIDEKMKSRSKSFFN